MVCVLTCRDVERIAELLLRNGYNAYIELTSYSGGEQIAISKVGCK